jgi:hypothetical protein
MRIATPCSRLIATEGPTHPVNADIAVMMTDIADDKKKQQAAEQACAPQSGTTTSTSNSTSMSAIARPAMMRPVPQGATPRRWRATVL